MSRQRILIQFGIAELANICKCDTTAIHHHIKSGRLVLEDLVSVTKFIAAYGTDDVRQNIGYAYGQCGEYGKPLPKSKKADSQKNAKRPPKVTQPITRIQG